MSLLCDSTVDGGVDIGDNISNSLMLDSTASQYLSRTPTVAGNRTTWTWSGWVKRGKLGATGYGLFGSYVSNTNYVALQFSSDAIDFVQYVSTAVTARKTTTAVFRDPAAWAHVVCVWDTTNSTALDRMRVYVNGVRITTFTTSTDPAASAPSQVNAITDTRIGYVAIGLTPYEFDGYLSNVHFIDGQALTPDNFGRFSADTGQWVPKQYTGTYGTNGFKLEFKNGSALGTDTSGNSNTWAVNGGITSANQYLDTPTNNFATLNGINNSAALSVGNLTVTGAGSLLRKGTYELLGTNKWYFEVSSTYANNTNVSFGAGVISESSTTNTTVTSYAYGIRTNQPGTNPKFYSIFNGTVVTVDLPQTTSSCTFMVAFDPATGNLWLGANGAWANGGNPDAGTAPATTLPTSTKWFPWVSSCWGADTTPRSTANFGQRPFAYAPPAGFKSLCSQNLPTPSILNPKNYFDVVTRTGTGAAYSVSGENFTPDFVWTKSRSAATDHILSDSVRGVNDYLVSDSAAAEVTNVQALTSFNAGGYSGGTMAAINTSAATYVDWLWKGNGPAVINNAGTIPSLVSANQQSGFSIVTYTGTGINATVGHGLGVAPKMVIVKSRTTANNWVVYHDDMASAVYAVNLNQTVAQTSNPTVFNSIDPTSNVFSIGTHVTVNTSAAIYVAYCFAEVPGYSKIGAYTGNGSVDGPFVYCGFKPRYILVKSATGATVDHNWMVIDSERESANVMDQVLSPNLPSAEVAVSVNPIDFTSTGFKMRGTGVATNTSAALYIFYAIADSSSKYATSRSPALVDFAEYTTAGTYSFTVPDGATALYVSGVGGGGGGSSVGGSGGVGKGGGAGGVVQNRKIDVLPGQVVAITVGAAGAGGNQYAGSSIYNGYNGTASIVTVNGTTVTMIAGVGSASTTGNGLSTPWGVGGLYPTGGGNGLPATGYGSGGGSGNAVGTGCSGGAGARGYVLISW